MANCDDKGKGEIKQCKEYRDDGYEACEREEDRGHNSCNSWSEECCDWWPCSWACDLITLICRGWVWISNVVCVAWYWVANLVCVAWVVTSYLACVIVDTLATVLGAIITALESIVGWFLDFVGWIVDLILSIPILGRLLKWVWNGVLTIIGFIMSAADSFGYLIGIRGEKKLRVCTILFCDERGEEESIAKREHVVAQLNKAIAVFRQAHVKIVRNGPMQFSSGFGSGDQADDSWITRYCQQGGNSADILDLRCDIEGGLDDLWTTGSQLQFILDTNCFFGRYRKLIGYGGPVAILVVRSVSGDDASGCASVLWDYVSVHVREQAVFEGDKTRRTIAHELGHACSLFHIDISGNLMKTGDGADQVKDTALTVWQQILIRSSRHVTYL